MNEENLNEKDISELRDEKLKHYLKKLKRKNNLIVYTILAVIVYVSIFIRTRNIQGLKDISTGGWTLGPDLDPFLFLRWAEYIVEHGKLFLLDPLRSIPLAEICTGTLCNPINTAKEARLLSYLIAWFHNFLSTLPSFLTNLLPGNPSEITIEYSGLLFPVFMFMLTIITFFFFTREVFRNHFKNKVYSNSVALIACLFLGVLPTILPRTIAGIPEKESAGFLFIFLAFYFIIKGFNSSKNKTIIIYSLLAGISTGILALIWGGVTFVFISVGISVFLTFILGRFSKKRLLSFTTWIIVFTTIMMVFSLRYNIRFFLTSSTIVPVIATWMIAVFDIYIYKRIKSTKLNEIRERFNIPQEILSAFIVAIIIFVLVITIFGIDFIQIHLNGLINQFTSPLAISRFALTVAENKQPFFINDWTSNFGPMWYNIPVFFVLFSIGSFFLFHRLVRKLSKIDRWTITISFILLIVGLIFSRYSSTSKFDGTSQISLVFYFGTLFIFLITSSYYIYKYNKINCANLFPKDFGSILVLTFFFFSLLGARGGIRFLMVVVPSASMFAAYILIFSIKRGFEQKNTSKKLLAMIFAAFIIIASFFSISNFYDQSRDQASIYHPSNYQHQWQKAMSWIRDNTSENAVFGHWWDYGYWIQSIGKRATILDGGNSIVYWNHLMGRHVLTNPDPSDKTALEFLKTHKATHYLIDSTDIGKYSAYSSIGGDENRDRDSFIPTIFMDESSTQQTGGETIYIYPSNFGLYEDIAYESDSGKQIFDAGKSLIGAILIKDIMGELQQPEAIILSQGSQANVPLRYLYFNGELKDFGSGIESGIFLMTSLKRSGNGININDKGAGYYLNERTVNSFIVRKYLFGEEGSFKLVHNEQNLIIENLKNQGLVIEDFAFFEGNFLGPIKIWEIDYDEGIKENPDFLLQIYPDKRLE